MLELYERIRMRREELNLSQDELAKKLGYRTRSSINKIEKGVNDIPQSKIKAFAIALDTTPEYLMGWTDKKEVGRESAPAPESVPDLSPHDIALIEAYHNASDEIQDIVDNTLDRYSKHNLPAMGKENRGKKEEAVG
jgi:transcriptional regulator with XRE-family HTH domain